MNNYEAGKADGRREAWPVIERLMRDIEDLRRDRDEWKQQHENLLAVRQQDIAALAARHSQPVRGVPDGYVLVPVKLTDDMVVAFAEAWYSQPRCYDDPQMDDCYAAMLAAAPSPAAQPVAPLAPVSLQGAQVGEQWISVDERLPEVGELVLVYSPPTELDHPGEVNIGFDCIDPNDDDHVSWLNHNEHYEHFCCVAKPEGSIGPSAEAPYTHWMPMPKAPHSTAAEGAQRCKCGNTIDVCAVTSCENAMDTELNISTATEGADGMGGQNG